MMKLYEINGLVYQFEEGTQPAGAKEVKPKAQSKEAKPTNKARATRTKKAE